MKEYEIIKTKLNNQDYDFDGELLAKLSEEEFTEINDLISTEIYKGNEKCYKFLKYLNGVNLAKLISTGHKEKIGADNWVVLATNVYLSYPKPSLLEYIVEMASENKKALEQLKVIAQQKPEILELNDIIREIETKNVNLLDMTEKKVDNNFEYYQLEFGAIVKVQKNNYLLYRLDPNTNMWVEDHEMFMEMATGSYAYKSIEMLDNYEYADAVDQSKGLL